MPIGQNVWFDLMTTNSKEAIRFYTESVGWKTEAWKDSDPKMPYTMWASSAGAFGGVMDLPAEAKGVPPHWVAYTLVKNVDESCKKVKSLGGAVHKDPFDIPKVGRVAFVADPQGASFAIFTPESGDMSAPDREVQGHFSWAELNTTDYEAAWKFYSELFGWQERDTMDMGEQGVYFMYHDAEKKTSGGMSNMAKQMGMPAHWLHYVNVDSVKGATDRIKRNGGALLMGPMDVPDGGEIAIFKDPQGAAFAIYGRKS